MPSFPTSALIAASPALRNSPLRGSDSPRFIQADDDPENAPTWEKKAKGTDYPQDSFSPPKIPANTDCIVSIQHGQELPSWWLKASVNEVALIDEKYLQKEATTLAPTIHS